MGVAERGVGWFGIGTVLLWTYFSVKRRLIHTDTLSWSIREAGAVVTLQPFAGVAGQSSGTRLTLLPSAHLAAPTAVEHDRDARRTMWSNGRAAARSIAWLAEDLKRHNDTEICCLQFSVEGAWRKGSDVNSEQEMFRETRCFNYIRFQETCIRRPNQTNI